MSDKYDRDILGLDVSGPATADDGSLLPVPSAPGERDQPPWPFLALTALGRRARPDRRGQLDLPPRPPLTPPAGA